MPLRPRFAFAVALLGALVAAVLPGLSSRAYTVQTVEVSSLGFNPGVCRMNREYVRFHNVGQTVIRVGRPGVIAGDPPFDVQEIKPGEYSIEIVIPYGGNTKFIDVDNPSHGVNIVTPVFVEYWEPICTPDPDFRPPVPPCRSNPHCLRVPFVAFD